MSDATTATLPSQRSRAGQAAASAPYLFFIATAEHPLELSSRHCLAGLGRVVLGRSRRDQGERAARDAQDGLRLMIGDAFMSQTHAVLQQTPLGPWAIEDQKARNGTFVNGLATARAMLKDGDLIELGHSCFLYREALPYPEALPADVVADAADALPGLGTLLPGLARDFQALAQIARSDLSVILHGESGTGKELMARALHTLSGRSGPLVAVNCGALPQTLIESELFGHVRGAFTGATQERLGLLRDADQGTLFLDEIADLPPGAQAALLRALQERQVVPVGGSAARPVPVDLRVCAATHYDLQARVAQGLFRADLLARLSGATVRLPPLRGRREDLGLLVSELLRRHLGAEAQAVRLTKEALGALLRYAWPLNVRELEKCLQRAVALAGPERRIELGHLPEALAHALEPSVMEPPPAEALALAPGDQERRDTLLGLLVQHRGNVTAVALVMGKTRYQIRRWMKRYGFTRAAFDG